MRKRKSLLGFLGPVVLLLSLSILLVQGGNKAVAEEKAVYGGRLNVGWTTGQAIETLRIDEAWELVDMGTTFWQLVYDQLWMVGPAPEYKVVPRLAKSWETKDRQTWTFHLVENAKWHDGKPVTAEDVKFTLEYLMEAMPVWSRPDTQFESISVIDEHTLKMKLKAAIGGRFPPVFWIPMLPKHIWEPYKDDMMSYPNEELIGSGPFKLKEFKPGEYIWFEANEDYWGGRPYVDEMVFKTYGSRDTLYMALRRGEIDMLGRGHISPKITEELKKVENIDVIESPGMLIWAIAFNLHKDNPIRNLNVRKAVMYGINRDRIVKIVGLGAGEVVDSPVYLELKDHNPNLPQYKYNPQRAKDILDKGEYVDTDDDGIRNDPDTGKNITFELLVPSDKTDPVKASTMIKEQLKDIGIDIVVKAVDDATWYDFSYTPEEDRFDISWEEFDGSPNYDWIWDYFLSYEGGGKGWNESYYQNPAFDELIYKMRTELDPQKRLEYLYELQMVLAEQLPKGWMFRLDTRDPVNTRFEGHVVMMGGISGWINPWTPLNVHLKK